MAAGEGRGLPEDSFRLCARRGERRSDGTASIRLPCCSSFAPLRAHSDDTCAFLSVICHLAPPPSLHSLPFLHCCAACIMLRRLRVSSEERPPMFRLPAAAESHNVNMRSCRAALTKTLREGIRSEGKAEQLRRGMRAETARISPLTRAHSICCICAESFRPRLPLSSSSPPPSPL